MQRAGKHVQVSHNWFGFTSDWMKNWREFFKANHVAWQTQNQLLFDTQMKTALFILS